jgi:hypothetical protein
MFYSSDSQNRAHKRCPHFAASNHAAICHINPCDICPDKRRHKPVIEDILSSLKKAGVSKSITRKVEIRYIKKDNKENNPHIIDPCD